MYRRKQKIQRFTGNFKVLRKTFIIDPFDENQSKPIVRYLMINVIDNDTFDHVSCKHVLKPNLLYYGEIREYGEIWRFTKINIPDNDMG